MQPDEKSPKTQHCADVDVAGHGQCWSSSCSSLEGNHETIPQSLLSLSRLSHGVVLRLEHDASDTECPSKYLAMNQGSQTESRFKTGGFFAQPAKTMIQIKQGLRAAFGLVGLRRNLAALNCNHAAFIKSLDPNQLQKIQVIWFLSVLYGKPTKHFFV